MAQERFHLSRLDPHEDMLELVQVAYGCFPPILCGIFMGCKSEADLPRLAEHYLKELREDPFTIWLKVVDKASGRIVAGSQWKVFPSFSPAFTDDKPPEWLEGEDLAKSTRVLEKMNAARRAANPKGYVHLHICFTDPNYRRKGAGGMMMNWGCNVADALLLPSWIEASPEGNFLYKRFGFYDYEHIYNGEFGDSSNMRREPRGLTQQGGES
ncbi:hypothetical protein KC332_g4448 [Hortaea werneckii]|nr:hypothetical protein KC350_g15920 [Hortaea werneckii]KAI6839206.1 hypothetical protein KC358_g4723 [Hortaea werneckii]KAI6924976.1 hypothetical protein KC341_g13725 [Hortaea werneckii]KAI6944331.1 hypothetical protein KC348_g3992 [Hortaea werneckii]KAI6961293.1 hypothetical protein KC321_g12388 [Hortaea werneckii]